MPSRIMYNNFTESNHTFDGSLRYDLVDYDDHVDLVIETLEYSLSGDASDSVTSNVVIDLFDTDGISADTAIEHVDDPLESRIHQFYSDILNSGDEYTVDNIRAYSISKHNESYSLYLQFSANIQSTISRSTSSKDIIEIPGISHQIWWGISQDDSTLYLGSEESTNCTQLNEGEADWTYAWVHESIPNDTITSVIFENTIHPQTTAGWFFDIVNLQDLENFEYLDTSYVTDMSTMFEGCHSLTDIDLSRFDTSNVTDMTSMFSGCYSLTSLDLYSFDISNIDSMMLMFAGCTNLQTIYASSDWNINSPTSDRMFLNCTSLIGGNDTQFDTNHIDGTYAHPDALSNPGYFTIKSEPQPEPEPEYTKYLDKTGLEYFYNLLKEQLFSISDLVIFIDKVVTRGAIGEYSFTITQNDMPQGCDLKDYTPVCIYRTKNRWQSDAVNTGIEWSESNRSGETYEVLVNSEGLQSITVYFPQESITMSEFYYRVVCIKLPFTNLMQR